MIMRGSALPDSDIATISVANVPVAPDDDGGLTLTLTGPVNRTGAGTPAMVSSVKTSKKESTSYLT